MPAPGVVAAVVLVNLGLAGMVGAVVCGWWLRDATSRWAAGARHRCRVALYGALAFTMLADVALLAQQAADITELPVVEAIGQWHVVLMQTTIGHAWLLGVAGLACVFGSMRRGRPSRTWPCAIGICLFVSARAAVSHAGAHGLASGSFVNELAHLTATSFWLGTAGVAACAVLTDRTPATADDGSDLAAWTTTLSNVAGAALFVVAVSGVFSAWRNVGTASQLTGSAYGITLVVKLAWVIVAVALGGINRWLLMPRWLDGLRDQPQVALPDQQRFVRVLRIEVGVLLVALMAAGVLSSSALPVAT